MQGFSNIINRAQTEVLAGRAWRAKEILQGNISNYSYSDHSSQPGVLELYLAYAKMLFELGDVVAAGKYFFLSNCREDFTHQAIKIFLDRFKTAGPLNIYRSFPKRAKLESLARYPAAVAQDLRELGVPEQVSAACGYEHFAPRSESLSLEQQKQAKRRQRLAITAGFLLLLLPYAVGIITCIIGVFLAVQWLVGIFF